MISMKRKLLLPTVGVLLFIVVLAVTLLNPHTAVQAATGSAWQLAWKATGTLYDLHMQNEEIMLGVGSEGMVVRTTNGGKSWSYLSVDPKFDLLAVDFTSPQQGIAVGSRGVIFYTQDGGETWLPGNTGANVTLYALDMLDATHGWAAGAQGVLLRTNDAGQTWQRVDAGATQDLHDLIFIDAMNGWVVGDGGTILHTSDGGNTWQHQAIQVRSDLWGVTFTDKFTGWAVGSNGVILSTVNGGGLWTAKTDTGFPQGIFHDVDCAAGVCYVVGENGATLRYDGSWNRFFDLNDTDRTLYAVAALDNRRAWSGGVRHTKDVEFNTSTLEYDAWGIFYTDNGAANWQTQTGDLFPRFRKLHFIDDQTGYVVGGDWSYRRTTDGGKTWTQVTAPPPGIEEHQFFYDVDCLDSDTCYLVGRYGVIRRTNDGGETWQEQAAIDSTSGSGRGYGKFLYSVAFQDEQNAFSGGSYRLFTTEDGTHWRRASTASGTVFDIQLIGDTDGIASTSTGYFIRRDPNGDWAQRSTYQSGVKLYGVDAKDADGDGRLDKAWLVGCKSTQCDTHAAIVLSDTGGNRWQKAAEVPAVPKLSDVSMVDTTHGWAVGDLGAIVMTIDGGNTWHAQFSPTQAHLESVQALHENLAFASGWDGVILRYGPTPLAFEARPQNYLASIDARFDEWGQDVIMRLDSTLAHHVDSADGQPPAASDASATVRMRWQESQLVLAIDVQDDDVTSGDEVQIAVDGLNDNLWGADDLMLSIHANGAANAPAGVRVAAKRNEHGYQMEVALPATLLGNMLAVGRSVGFNFALHDSDDDGSSADLIWAAAEMAETPDRFIDIKLIPFDASHKQLVAFAASGQVVDGNLSDWDALSTMILDAEHADSQFGPATTAKAQVQLQWQPQGLLGAIQVQDADVQDTDSVIIALDGNNDGRNTSDQDIILAFGPQGPQFSINNLVSFSSPTEEGYSIEFFLPISVLGGNLTHDRTIGMNISLIDTTQARDTSLLVWEGASPDANFGDFGQLIISDRLLILQAGRDGFTDVQDATIDVFHAADNYADAPIHLWRGNPNKSTVIRFGFDTFPQNATPTGGSLSFKVLSNAKEAMTVSAYALIRDWEIQEVTWAYARLGIRWQVPGARGENDRQQTASDAHPLTGPGWINFDVDDDVIAMINQKMPNRGWVIEPTGAFSEFQVAASEYATPEERPKLTIRYVLPVAQQPQATPTPTPTSTPTPTPTPTATPTPIPHFLPMLLHAYEIPPVFLPDLAPVSMSIDTEHPLTCTSPEQPAVLGLRARFANSGNKAAASFAVELNGVRQRIPNLGVNQEESVWTPGFVLGVNTLRLDVEQQIIESDESNNTLMMTLPLPTPLPTCTPAP